MRRQFIQAESRGKNWLNHFRQQSGIIELIAGGTVVIALVICNLFALVAENSLKEEDLPYQPPQWLFLQRLLYQPITLKVNQVDELSSFDFTLSESVATTTSDAGVFTIISQPNFTARIGSNYVYQPKLDNANPGQTFELRRAPAGMNIAQKTGRLTWKPAPEDYGEHLVELAVINESGSGVQQSYKLMVSRSYHPFGTVMRGRGLLASLILGTQWILIPGLIVVAVSTILGTLCGGLAGYYGGRIELVMSYIINLITTLPALVLLFLSAALFHFNIYPVMVIAGLIWLPRVAATVKAKVASMKEMDFVEATRELGLTDSQILWSEIVWHNCRYLLITLLSYGFAFAILVQVTLSYLGIGQKDTFSWGNMLLSARDRINYSEYWAAFFTSVALVLAIAAFYLVADGINRISKSKE